MYPTVTLQVRVRSDSGRDRLGNEVVGWAEPVSVPGCLWAPGTPADLADSRPEGASVTATAHMPRGWRGCLRGALVSPDGRSWLRVLGEPQPYPEGAVMGPWDTYVLLGRTDG
jgi:hypothetical protein